MERDVHESGLRVECGSQLTSLWVALVRMRALIAIGDRIRVTILSLNTSLVGYDWILAKS